MFKTIVGQRISIDCLNWAYEMYLLIFNIYKYSISRENLTQKKVLKWFKRKPNNT